MKSQQFTVKAIAFWGQACMTEEKNLSVIEDETIQGEVRSRFEIPDVTKSYFQYKAQYERAVGYPRRFTRFAWYPKRMSNGRWIFWKKYTVLEL